MGTREWLDEMDYTAGLADADSLPDPIETQPETDDFKKFEGEMQCHIKQYKISEGFATRRAFILGAYFVALDEYIESLPKEKRKGKLSSFKSYCEEKCELSISYIYKLKDLYQQLGEYVRFQHIRAPVRELLKRKNEIVKLLEEDEDLQECWKKEPWSKPRGWYNWSSGSFVTLVFWIVLSVLE